MKLNKKIIDKISIFVNDKENLRIEFYSYLVNKLKEPFLVELLLDKQINENTKINISKFIKDELSIESQKEITSILDNLLTNQKDIEKSLFLDYIPKCYKYSVLEKDNDINSLVEKILNDKTPLKLRKLYIDYLYDNYFVYNFKKISETNSKSIKDYIINEKTKSIAYFKKSIVLYEGTPYEKELIEKAINKDNVYKLYDYVYENSNKLDLFLSLKGDEFVQSLRKKEAFELIYILNNKNIPLNIKEKIIKENKIKLTLFLKSVFIGFFQHLFYMEKTKEVENLLKIANKNIVKAYLLLSPEVNVIKWLSSDYTDEEYKRFLYKYKKLKLKRQIKKASLSDIYSSLERKYDNNYDKLIKEMIYKLRGKSIIESLHIQELSDVIYNLKKINDDNYTNIVIQNYLNKNNLIDFLEQLQDDYEKPNVQIIIKKIIEENSIFFKEILDNQSNNDIFRSKIKNLNSKIRNEIVLQNKEYLKARLSNFENNILIDKLKNDTTLKQIKYLILENYGYDYEDAQIVRKLVELTEPEIILNHYKKIKELFKKSNINMEVFISYGVGSFKYKNWLDSILYIISNNKEDEFVSIKNYLFNNYYNDKDKENNVYDIENLLEVLSNYKDKEKLFINLENEKKQLSKSDIKNLNVVLKTKTDIKIENYDDLSSFRKNTYHKVKEQLSKDLDIKTIKNILDNLILTNVYEALDNIGGISALKLLELSNPNSKAIKSLTNELILYTRIQQLIEKTNDKASLNNIVQEIFKNENSYIKTQDMFFNIKEKVRNLYELESKINLTNIDSIPKTKEYLNDTFIELYGGLTYNFSDKNYCLYAHVLSERENMEDFMQGRHAPQKNFISLSPISYKGQKYYYNNDKMILAFDKIPTGSFICSSTSNMGSNYNIKSYSAEVGSLCIDQRGILETSAVTKNNSEALLYREGLIPAGIVLPDGRHPYESEIMYHKKYNLPFIITQNKETAIESPKMVFKQNDNFQVETDTKELQRLFNIVEPLINIKKEDNIYTGREIAIITDIHALLEPTLEVLETIKRRGITEIYSLGDNIGSGPNPKEVIDLLEAYNVQTILGNSEYYMILGTQPFLYLDEKRIENEQWTKEELGTTRIERLKQYKPSKDIIIGNKKVALCHFINDIRWNYDSCYNTYDYQRVKTLNKEPIQFDYTNSEEAKKVIEEHSLNNKKKNYGYISAKNDPIFQGKQIYEYTDIFQGHVHYEYIDKLKDTNIITLEAMAIGLDDRDKEKASYYILKERKDGNFDIKKGYVNFNRNYLISNIKSSKLPHKEKILSFIN